TKKTAVVFQFNTAVPDPAFPVFDPINRQKKLKKSPGTTDGWTVNHGSLMFGAEMRIAVVAGGMGNRSWIEPDFQARKSFSASLVAFRSVPPLVLQFFRKQNISYFV
ncbi:MAG: hypothetical protein ACLQVW_25340, partial [Limisphaerales bacterium]